MDFIAILAVILAYIVKGMCGFANTLVFSTIMSFTANNINITPVELLVGYPSNLFIVWKERRGISTRVFLPLTLMVIAGILPGIFLLKNGDIRMLKVLFGFAVVVIGMEMLLRARHGAKEKSSKLLLIAIGILSGLLCGLFGIGAFLVAYISRTTKDQSQFKGNLCVVFLIENTVRIVLYLMTGIINLTVAKQALVLMPFMIVGLLIGMFLSKRSGEKLVRKAVIILLILTGCSIIINNLISI